MPKPEPCSHPRWVNLDGTGPLGCQECRDLWPGAKLPEPATAAGRTRRSDPDFVPWHRRVSLMTGELGRLEP